MLDRVFANLEQEIQIINSQNRADGLTEIPHFFIKVLGQTALIEANLGIPLFTTLDVDAYTDFVWLAKQCFCRVLEREGRHFDELSHEIWMPEETQYRLIHRGSCFNGYLAEPEYVLLSKAMKAPTKNRSVIRDYLALGPSALFVQLAATYDVDLGLFV